jgi:uncharacterized membrane protein
MPDNPMDPNSAQPPAAPAPASEAPVLAGADVIRDQDKIQLVLAYFGILALIPLITVKDSDYVHWHAKQGTALMALWFAWALVGGIIVVIPVAGACLYSLVHLGFLVLAAMGIIKAFGPSRWKIPVVCLLAEKF